MKKTVLMITFLLFVVLSGTASSASPDLKLPYQKKLAAAATSSTTATPVTFKFALYDAEVDGNKYWEESKTISITNTTRLISTNLGDSTGLDVADFNNQLWVQVESNGSVLGPRDKLVVAPYAIWSAASNVPGIAGPQGPKGDKGDPGNSIVGPPGPAGPVGPQGSVGAQGVAGATGSQGAQGPKGDSGSAGPQGVKGDTGATGPQGIQGVKGDTGAPGPQGIQGQKGDTGATGPEGPQGPMGAGVVWRGPFDPLDPNGYAAGDVVQYNGKAWIASDLVRKVCLSYVFEYIGNRRLPICVSYSTDWPTPGSTDGDVWQLFASGGVGPQGPAGLTGPQGPKGDTGTAGAQGPPGAQGFTGPQGPQGVAGNGAVIGGKVQADGTVLAGSGFTVTVYSTPDGGKYYSINFASSGFKVCTATPRGPGAFMTIDTDTWGSYATVELIKLNTQLNLYQLVTGDFIFICMKP